MIRPSFAAIAIALVALTAQPVPGAEPPAWPPVREGLCLAWSTALEPAHVRGDDGQTVPGWAFTREGRGRLNHHGALVLDCGGFVGERALAAAGEPVTGTLSLWITPRAPKATGPILRIGRNDTALTVAQIGPRFQATLGAGAAQQQLEAPVPPVDGPIHLALVIAEDRLTLHVDGHERASRAVDAQAWADPASTLIVGAPDGNPHFWTGRVEGITIYSRALTPSDLEANGNAYATRMAAREPVSHLRVRARLTGKSTIFTPKDLAPYTRGLCVFQYQVLDVLMGSYAAEKLHVAHWTVLDRTLLPFVETTVGTEHELTLERLEDNPQLDAEHLSDDIVTDFSLPYYYDAGGLAIACDPTGK